jgi:pimeloyl-ACP methyl ester carboxylesterase
METLMTIAFTLALAALSSPASAAPSAVVAVESTVAVSGADLAVTLAVPKRKAGERVAAVLVLPGSGCLVRAQSQAFADAFLRAGLAVLTFDKRGCGASTGSWLKSSLDDMASDARTLFDWLEAREEIDRGSIGVVGVSQGGWVGPLLAAARPGTAFLIGLTGGALTPRAVETFDYERKLAHGGIEGSDLESARKAVRAYLAYLAGEAPRSEVVGLLGEGKSRPWYPLLGLERVLPDESFRAAWAWVPTFDPLPSIRALRLPVLAIIGGLDRDPAAEVKAWQTGLSGNPNPRTEIRVAPGSGHVLTLGDAHKPGAFNVPGLDAMAAWAASIVRPERPVTGR